ncbi:DNA-binding transcriptional regulator, MarR family [Sphingobium sp. AP50]|uniref:MarR family winged helix-turn-helix transcriptional regulator n=1 Tax=Sphingobium sp. AP50 TaxID=1884369 RepID=UPI0008D14E63|nr:MarR family transcriptional regulator [Sphingobium sp. AP50]SEJ98477.1 DNA-binding transcriptional regulator, MarR family [Sphingobium sp. AP50]
MTIVALDLDRFLPYRLSYTASLLSDLIAGAYADWFDISILEWRVLAWVGQGKGITQQEICVRTRMDKVAVSRAAIALSRRGMIQKKPNVSDGRSRLLELTADGEHLYRQIAPRALELEHRLFARFSADQLAAFTTMLQQIDDEVVRLKSI